MTVVLRTCEPGVFTNIGTFLNGPSSSRMLLVVDEEWKQLKQTMCQIRGDSCKEQDLGEVGGQAWAAKTHFKVVVRRDKHSFRVRT